MFPLLDKALLNASLEIDRVRNDLQVIDATTQPHPVERDRNANIISASYVWTAAIIEKFFKEILEGLLEEINNSNTNCDQVKICLLSLSCSSDFASLQNIRGLKMWNKRADLFSVMNETSVVKFNLSVLPLDGRTIRADHCETIWKNFGIGGLSLPDIKHKLALNDIADGRNDVAHGDMNPISFGRSKVPGDVVKTVGYIEDIVIHVYISVGDYLKNKDYLR